MAVRPPGGEPLPATRRRLDRRGQRPVRGQGVALRSLRRSRLGTPTEDSQPEGALLMATTQGEQTASVPRQQQRRYDEPEPTGWTGWVGFAGIIMVLVGTFGAIEGLVGIFKDQYYLVSKNDLVVSVDYTAWGWTHLILGILVVAAGFGVLVGQLWARAVGILLAMVSAIVNIAFLAAYPVWSTIVITLDVIVIWALAVHGREMKVR